MRNRWGDNLITRCLPITSDNAQLCKYVNFGRHCSLKSFCWTLHSVQCTHLSSQGLILSGVCQSPPRTIHNCAKMWTLEEREGERANTNTERQNTNTKTERAMQIQLSRNNPIGYPPITSDNSQLCKDVNFGREEGREGSLKSLFFAEHCTHLSSNGINFSHICQSPPTIHNCAKLWTLGRKGREGSPTSEEETLLFLHTHALDSVLYYNLTQCNPMVVQCFGYRWWCCFVQTSNCLRSKIVYFWVGNTPLFAHSLLWTLPYSAHCTMCTFPIFAHLPFCNAMHSAILCKLHTAHSLHTEH